MKPTAYLSIGVLALFLTGFNLQANRAEESELPALLPGSDVPARSLDGGASPNGEASQIRPSSELLAEASFGDPYLEPEVTDPTLSERSRLEPLRIALQAGHWKASEAPDELSGLRRNGGTRGGGKYEWEVNLEIAELAASLLSEAGYDVEVLPATVPPRYRADAFIAIHADGNNDPSVRGFRVGSPRRDATRRAAEFADVLSEAYGEKTGIRRLPSATRRMRGYYAFRYNRYQHAIHPLTMGVIIETGFLTSPVDREVLIRDPALAAQGIFDGVTRFLGPPIVAAESTPTDLASN